MYIKLFKRGNKQKASPSSSEPEQPNKVLPSPDISQKAPSVKSTKAALGNETTKDSVPGPSQPAPSEHKSDQNAATGDPSQDGAPPDDSNGDTSKEPPIPSRKLWAKAMDRVRKEHSDEWQQYCDFTQQKHLITQDDTEQSPPSSPDEVLHTVKSVQKNIEDSQYVLQLGSRELLVRDMCGKVVDALAGAKDYGAPAASLNPYASLAWSGFQLFLQNLSTAKEKRQMCWEVVPRATYLISRYQTLDELYTSDPDLQQSRALLEDHLIALYTLILRYQITMVIYMSSRSMRFKESFGKASTSRIQVV